MCLLSHRRRRKLHHLHFHKVQAISTQLGIFSLLSLHQQLIANQCVATFIDTFDTFLMQYKGAYLVAGKCQLVSTPRTTSVLECAGCW